MLSRRLTTALITAAAAVSLVGATVASAEPVEKTTKWYTFDVMPSSPTAAPVYVEGHDPSNKRVQLNRYSSGNLNQQWASVDRDYPTAPGICGGVNDRCSGLFDAFSCGSGTNGDALPSCGFAGHGGVKVKMVNRASAKCLSVFKWTPEGRRSVLVQDDCKPGSKKQLFDMTFRVDEATGTYATLEIRKPEDPNKGRRLCVDVTVRNGNSRDHRRSPGTPLTLWNCASDTYPDQQFRFLPVGESTCTVQFFWQICR